MSEKVKFDRIHPQVLEYVCNQTPNGASAFSSLQELLDFLDQFDTSGCYFRGQSGLWPIKSSLFRHHGTPWFIQAQRLAAVAMNLLKKNEHLKNVVQDDDNRALAIAQHYGCPTDLVDLTTSLRISGYFASLNNQYHKDQPLGCIWVFTEEDIQSLAQMASVLLVHTASVPEGMTDKLTTNNGSLLFKPDMPELSRLNAQKGLFIWDIGGTLNTLIEVSGAGIRFDFKHTSDERSLFAVDEGFIFPKPNELESEIMRIFTEKGRENGLSEYIGPIERALDELSGRTIGGLPSCWSEHADARVVLPLPDYFTPSFGTYRWPQRTVTQNAAPANHVKRNASFQYRLTLDQNGMKAFVQDVIRRNNNEDSVNCHILLDMQNQQTCSIEDTEYMVNMLICLNNYSYSEDEIAQVLLEYLKIIFFTNQSTIGQEAYTKTAPIEQLDVLVAKYYGCPVTKIDLREAGGSVSFWLPGNYEFLDSVYSAEFGKFDKHCNSSPYCYPVQKNAEIFLYQHDPQKIMPFENMRQMFIKLILPQLFAVRPEFERLYIPDHISAITLPINGRTLLVM